MFTRFPLVSWLVTLVALLAVVVLDLAVIGRRKRVVSARDAVSWVCAYVSLAALFAIGLYIFGPGQSGGQFVAGYVTEYALSVDNLFVFLVIMSRFAVPPLAQDKALYVGIVGSMLLRTVFIVAGATALAVSSWVFYLFGGLLLYTAARAAMDHGEAANREDNFAVRVLARVLPTTAGYVGTRVFTRSSGQLRTTPLLVVIVAISIANVVFAVDSLPAIFGLTQDAYLIFTANAFALMGLRQLFFLIGDLLERLTYLDFGIAAILAFIGIRLIFEALRRSQIEHVWDVRVPSIGIGMSLAFIAAVLFVTAAASFAQPWWRRRRNTD